MRDLIRQAVAGYKSLKLEGQDEGYVLFSGREADTKQAVHIKVLPRLMGEDPQIAAAFRRLSQSIRRLNHPHIAPIRKMGEESGLPYLVTRAVEKGRPLVDKLDQPWAVDAAADVVMQVGQALEHAYRKGVVHGSLTPENIVVQDSGRVVVTDFGMAELQDLLGAHLQSASSPYQAPERAAGKEADTRADVYSLAAVLYSMLAKRNPQVVQGQVLPPSRFNPEVPPAMDKVVVKALASDPADRYPDVKSFLTAFGAVMLAPMVKSRPASAGVRCPQCGQADQTGRFCRKCGTRLEQPDATLPAPPAESLLDEPIQITKVEVGKVTVGKGIEVQETSIAEPLQVATGELHDQFPQPLEMPTFDTSDLWPTMGAEQLISIPEPPLMPVIDWAEIAPPMPEVPVIEDAFARQEEE